MKQKILVHICCAICGVALIEKLKENFEPVLFFYNPNIYPVAEYQKRKESVVKMAEIYELEFISAKGGPASGWDFSAFNNFLSQLKNFIKVFFQARLFKFYKISFPDFYHFTIIQF
jgi:hypothetical protein